MATQTALGATSAPARTAPEEIFRALADTTRLRCLLLIAGHEELCVCELVYALEMSQPKISRHLKLLRDSGLVDDRRERVWVHYRISDDLPTWVRDTLNATRAAHADRSPFVNDAAHLARMPDRPSQRCAE